MHAPMLAENTVHNPLLHRDGRYNDRMELEDAVHTALLVLKESFEGQMNSANVEVGIADRNGFRRLSPAELDDYLSAIS